MDQLSCCYAWRHVENSSIPSPLCVTLSKCVMVPLCVTWSIYVKAGLHIVVAVAEHACDDAPKGILKLSTCRLQIFLVEDQYFWSLQRCSDQSISVQLEKHVLKRVLAILTTCMETRLNIAGILLLCLLTSLADVASPQRAPKSFQYET